MSSYTCLTLKHFSECVVETMEKYPVETIAKIIYSIDERVTDIIECKGQRLKY